MTPLRNNKSFLDSICFFKLGLLNVISEASRILWIRLFSGAVNKIFPENLWKSFISSVLHVQNLWKYPHVLSIAVLLYVSFRQCISVDVCLQTHIPLYMAHDGFEFLLFNWKSCLNFFVIYFILISFELLIISWNILMKRFEGVNF